MASQSYYRRLKAQGLCTCGQPVKAERVSCAQCLKRRVEEVRASQQRRKRAGMCITGGCKSGAAQGHTMCEPHLARMRGYAEARRRQRRTTGLCVDCGNPSELGQALCLTCSAEYRRGLPLPVRGALRRFRKSEEQRKRDADALKTREFIDRNLYLIRSERARQILQMRYGYTEAMCATLEEVGKHFDLTRERIRQLQQSAERTIRMFTIEKNIPLPPLSDKDQAAKMRETLLAMDVGDSFLYPSTKKTKSVTGIAKDLGMIVTTRKVSETERRVWLVSKNADRETEGKAA